MFNQEELLVLTQALPRNWGLVAINGQKAPYQNNWQHPPLTPKQIAAKIQQNPYCQAVGVLCGTRSGGLLFVDHDGVSCDRLIESLSGLPVDEAVPTTVQSRQDDRGAIKISIEFPNCIGVRSPPRKLKLEQPTMTAKRNNSNSAGMVVKVS